MLKVRLQLFRLLELSKVLLKSNPSLTNKIILIERKN